MSMPKNITKILILLMLILGWRAVFLTVSVQHINLSGDEAIRSLQAISIAQPKESIRVQLEQEPPGLFGHYPLLFMAQPYLFPIESYISAPFIRSLPRSEFGSRLIPAIMGIITCLLGVLLVNAAFPKTETRHIANNQNFLHRYGVILLVVFPSTLLLVLQGAYPLPSYPAFMMFGLLSLWLAERNRITSWKNPFFAFAAGLSVALAASNSLLALPLVAGIGTMIAVGRNWRTALVGSLSCGLGIGLGLFPYFLAKTMYPGAHAAVSSMVHWDVALKRLWEPAITFTLPIVLGMRCPILPGWEELPGILPMNLLSYGGYLWVLLIICAFGSSIYLFFQRLFRNRWPEITVWDVVTGLSVGYLLIFVLSTRFGANEFRYLMPVALFFPLVLARLLSISKGMVRNGLAVIVWGLVAINLVTSTALLTAWLHKDFDGGFADTRPAVGWLKQEGIKYCYSSYMDTYTLNYFAGDKLICAQPYNQRFPGWPYPYGKAVDTASNAAFVLGPSKRFPHSRLTRELQESGVQFQVASAASSIIYYNFTKPNEAITTQINPVAIKVTTSHHQEDADTLSDGILSHKWRSREAQKKGMWINLQFVKPTNVQQLKFYYNGYTHDHARSLDISAQLSDGSWKQVAHDIKWRLQHFDFINNQPVYNNRVQNISVQAKQIKAIRIEINKPNPGRDWTIGEIKVQVL
ncbi:MAG: hypothetical protein JKY62_14395 [Desulfocapsa sp.]|nr:hypothetical protein [Desulfocapsa sp.]